jgi:hypothetical protein
MDIEFSYKLIIDAAQAQFQITISVWHYAAALQEKTIGSELQIIASFEIGTSTKLANVCTFLR